MFHKVVLLGNVGRDPELRFTPAGQAVTNLSVATNRAYTGSDGSKVEETVWFRVTCWGKLAETVAQYVKKGRTVLVEGRLIPDATGNPKIWNRADGTPGASFEINAQTVRFVGGRPGNGNGDADNGADEPEEEIPF